MFDIGTTNKCLLAGALIVLVYLLRRGAHIDRERMADFKVQISKRRRNCDARARMHCSNPNAPFTASQKWRNEYKNGSFRMKGPARDDGHLGNYSQVTNNNLWAPNNLTCGNGMRADETCRGVDRVRQRCYTNAYNRCK